MVQYVETFCMCVVEETWYVTWRCWSVVLKHTVMLADICVSCARGQPVLQSMAKIFGGPLGPIWQVEWCEVYGLDCPRRVRPGWGCTSLGSPDGWISFTLSWLISPLLYTTSGGVVNFYSSTSAENMHGLWLESTIDENLMVRWALDLGGRGSVCVKFVWPIRKLLPLIQSGTWIKVINHHVTYPTLSPYLNKPYPRILTRSISVC